MFFDDEVFPAAAGRQDWWLRNIELGVEAMADLSVVIGGCVRDAAPRLLENKIALLELAGLFGSARFVFFENDSTDATPAILREWQTADDRVTAITMQRHDPKNPTARCLKRADRMAGYRNIVQSEIREQHAQADYVLLVDPDVFAWSWRGIAVSFARRNSWDFVGSNSLMFRYGKWVYFDSWAYRPYSSFYAQDSAAVNNLSFVRGDDFLPVSSCFGGIGIYRTPAFLSASYDGSDCEHVCLHRKMAHNGFGRLFLNPSQIVIY
jgi:hypothetical protein